MKKWAEKLGLKSHGKGGYHKKNYTSKHKVTIKGKEQRAGSAHYYYLESDDFFSWHRVPHDQIWHFYSGCDVMLHLLDEKGNLTVVHLGSPESGEHIFPQYLIPGDTWIAAELTSENSYSFLGLTSIPELQDNDCELADAEELIEKFPQHEEILRRLTRSK